MSISSPYIPLDRPQCTIDDLPDEVLEYILSLVPPYKDLEECSLVCKRWLQSSKNVMYHTRKSLHRAVSSFTVHWESLTPLPLAPSITKRYSHSACRLGNVMYVFGGCTSTSTTFNDLWRLDLSRRVWVRPLTMGTYPSPKACASLVSYEDALWLFGGWTHPNPYPLHQAWRLFNELHTYNIACNRWMCVDTASGPPAMAGHSASVQGHKMVVFGGLQKTTSLPGHYASSNDIWLFDFEYLTWSHPTSISPRPQPRYGQSHIRLDDTHMLIIGGCGGPNMVYSDVWLLTLTGTGCTWTEVQVRNQQWAAQHMWCHPACKVGDRVVLFSRHPVSAAPALPYTAQWNPSAHLRVGSSSIWVPPRQEQTRRLSDEQEAKPVDRDTNVNGRRGTLTRPSTSQDSQPDVGSSSSGEEGAASPIRPPKAACPAPVYFNPSPNFTPVDACPNTMAAFRDPAPRPCGRQRQRQLESLQRMEDRIKAMSRGAAREEKTTAGGKSEPAKSSGPRNPLALFTLDISHALTENYVSWLPYSDNMCAGPEETILYSLVAGKGESRARAAEVVRVCREGYEGKYVGLGLHCSQPIAGYYRCQAFTAFAFVWFAGGPPQVIMFGGIQKDASSIASQSHEPISTADTVSNSLHFVTADRRII